MGGSLTESPERQLWLAMPCDLACLGFALWTITCHAVVFAGGRPAHLYGSAAGVAAAVAVLGAGLWWWRGGRWLARAVVDGDDPVTFQASGHFGPRGPLMVRAGAALGALLCAGLWLRTGDMGWFLLSAGPLVLLLCLFQGAYGPPERPARVAIGWAVVFGLLSAAFTAKLSRPDGDEAFYLAMATSLSRFPELPLLSFDPLHGIPQWPLQMAVYRVHSWELLAAVLGAATGVWPIYFTHAVFSAFAGFLVPLGLLRLAREVAPRTPLWVAAAAFAVLVCDGSTHRSFGNFALVRLYQGKAVFVTLIVPLLLAYGLRFGRAPSVRRFMLLAAAQVTAIGLTATALPLAPLVAMAGVVSGLSARRPAAAVATLGLGLGSAAYPLAVALHFYAQVAPRAGVVDRASDAVRAAVQAPEAAAGQVADVVHALERVLGDGPMAAVYLGALLFAPALSYQRGARLAVNLGVLLFCGVANPWLKDVVAAHVVGTSTYWRLAWVVPFPMLVALTYGTPLLRLLSGTPAIARYGVPSALFAAALFALPTRTTWSEDNRIQAPRAGLKVDQGFAVARAAAGLVPPQGGVVCVSGAVARWLPAMPERAFPTMVEDSYLRKRELPWRAALHRCLSHRARSRRCKPAFLARALRRLRVDVVGVRPHTPHYRRFVQAMTGLGMAPRTRVDGYELWARP